MKKKLQSLWQAFQGFFGDFAKLGHLWPFVKKYPLWLSLTAMFIPLIAGLQSIRPFLLKEAIDKGILPADANYLWYMGLLFGGVVFFEYIFRASQSLASAWLVHRSIADMRRSLVSHILRLPMRYHDRKKSGSLVTRATSDFNNLSESLIFGIVTGIIDLAALVGCMIGMFFLSPGLTGLVLLVLPVVFIVIGIMSNILKKTMLIARKKIAELNAFIQETIASHTTIKLTNAQEQTIENADKLGAEYRDMQMRSVVVDASLFAFLDGVSSICIGLAMWTALAWVDPNTASGSGAWLSAGLLVAMVQYIQQVFEPLKQLGNKIAMLQSAFTAIDRIFSLFEVEQEYANKNAGPMPEYQEENFKEESTEKKSALAQFTQHSFAYTKNQPVIKNLSAHIECGKITAIVGSTGSGKSTLSKLITKLYDSDGKSLQVLGRSISDWHPEHLRKKFGIVPQECVLFKGTLAFNLHMGREGISDDSMIKALSVVGLSKEQLCLDSNKDLLSYAVDENGKNLSMGQRQLVVFARALARDPDILLLDEATSSLDPETELVVQEAMQAMLGGRTALIIAHRMRTIEIADKVIVMKKGEIAEQGSRQELFAQQGSYYDLKTAG